MLFSAPSTDCAAYCLYAWATQTLVLAPHSGVARLNIGSAFRGMVWALSWCGLGPFLLLTAQSRGDCAGALLLGTLLFPVFSSKQMLVLLDHLKFKRSILPFGQSSNEGAIPGIQRHNRMPEGVS
eukprot:1078851-Pelagomonas_calceolata.AAC.4